MPIPETFSEIDELIKRAYRLRGEDLKSSIKLTEHALDRCQELDYKGGIARAETNLSLFYLIQGDFDLAFRYSFLTLAYFESKNDKKGIADSKYNIGSIYYRTEDYTKGLQSLIESLTLYRELEDFHNQARALKSIGTIYGYFGDYNKCINTYIESIELCKRIGDFKTESNAYNPLSGIYLKRGEIELAMKTIQRSIELKEQTGDIRGFGFALYGRGKVFVKLKEYKKAEEDLLKGLAIQLEAGDRLGAGMVYNKLGILFTETGQPELAREYLFKALDIGEKYKIRFIHYKAYQNLYQLSKNEGKIEEALTYLEKYTAFKESIFGAETMHIINSYESIGKIEKLQREAQVQAEKTDIIQNKNAELDSFFYRVSHDLKGPISSLLGLHNLIVMEVEDGKSMHYFNMYHSQVKRINNIVVGLINLTRLNYLQTNPQQINFDELIDECFASYSYMPHFREISFIKEIDSKIIFKSEWSIINTVLQNLIENAIKYSRKDVDSFVRVSIQRKDRILVMEVEDNGQGIHPEHQKKIFDMFYRATDIAQGSGLGLYILKRAVERLSGTISLESIFNKSSKFVVELPFNE
jgi:signal transduction histidine kinase